MFKFIHAADIHLDSPLHRLGAYEGVPVEAFRRATRRAFENLIQLAISKKVSFVLIAGDLWDGDWKDYNTGLYLVSCLKQLNTADIPVYMIAGNHDAASRISKTLRFPENVKMFSVDAPETITVEGLDVALHGQGFASPAMKKDLSKKYPEAVTGHYNIGMLHTCATGREGHESYAPCSIEALKSKGYDYWALGHVHTREILSEDPLILFPGNIQGRHIRETGPKGCMLVTVDDTGGTTPVFKSLDVVRWESVHVDARNCDSGYDILDRLSEEIERILEANGTIPMALRIHVHGETPVQSEILSDTERWLNETRALAIDAGSGQLWVEKVKFDLSPPLSDQPFQRAEGALGELLKLFDELQAGPQGKLQLFDELQDLQRKLPHELKMELELKNGGEEWLKYLMTRVRPMLVRRLLNKGISS